MTLYKSTHTNTQIVMGIILITATQSSLANWLDIDDMFSGMEKQMSKMRQEMQEMQRSMQAVMTQQCKGAATKAISTKLAEDTAGMGIVITVSNLEATSIDAQIDDHSGALRIAAANATIKIVSRDTFIALDVDETIKQEEEKTKDGALCGYFSAQSRSYSKESLKKAVDLEKAKIDYNPKEQVLTISIAYADETKTAGKKVPVTILKAPAEEKEQQAPAK